MNSFLLDTVRTQVQRTPLDKSPAPRELPPLSKPKIKEPPLRTGGTQNKPIEKKFTEQKVEEKEINRIQFHEVLSSNLFLKRSQEKLEQETGLSDEEIRSLTLLSPLNQEEATEEINPSEFLSSLSMLGGVHSKKSDDQEEETDQLFEMGEGVDFKGQTPENKTNEREDQTVRVQNQIVNPNETKVEKVVEAPLPKTFMKDDLVVKDSLGKGENTADQDILNVNVAKNENQNTNTLSEGEKIEKQPDQEKNAFNTLKNISKDDKNSPLKSSDDDKRVQPEEPANQTATKLNQQKESLALQLNLIEDGAPKVKITAAQRANLKQTTYLEEQTKHQLISAQEEESGLPSFEDLKREWIAQTAPDEEKDLPQDIKNFNASVKENKTPNKAGEGTIKLPSSSEMLPQQAPGSVSSGLHNVEAQKIPVYTAPHQASLASQLFQGILNARQENTNRFFIQMQPPKLGMVKVDLEFKDGRMRAVFSAEKKTLNLLKDDTQKLEQSLKEMGIEVDPDGFEFTLSDQSTSGEKTPFEETSKLHEMIAEKFLKTEEMVPLATDLKSHFISLNHTFHEVA